MPATPSNWMPLNRAAQPTNAPLRANRTDGINGLSASMPLRVQPMLLPCRFRPRAIMPFLAALALSSCTMMGLSSDDDQAPQPTVELAREGPFEVVCMDSGDNEVTSYGPLFRVLRNNGLETRWQYEMEAGLTFIGRFDDLLTCEWQDRRLEQP